MSIVNATFDVPEHVANGLSSGIYERVGGVVRESGSKQVVAWLRENFEKGDPTFSKIMTPSPVNALSSTLNLAFSSVSAASGILNLAVSTTGFIIVTNRLDIIKNQLEQAQEILGEIDYKINLTFYSKFRAACVIANDAYDMLDPKKRESYFRDAITRFSEVIEDYKKLTDKEIGKGSPVAGEYLSILCLAIVTQVRCYLEEELLGTARRHLQDGVAVLRPLFEQHIKTLLTSNPAAYLHPRLKGQVGLKRLTEVYQWLEPGLNESDVFEMQRENLFILAQKPEEWINSLPQAIRIPKVDSATETNWFNGIVKDSRKKLEELPSKFKNLGTKPSSQDAVTQPPEIEIIDLLPATMELMKSMVEDDNRLVMYESELEAIQQSELSFLEWRQLMPPSTAEGNEKNLFYITVS